MPFCSKENVRERERGQHALFVLASSETVKLCVREKKKLTMMEDSG